MSKNSGTSTPPAVNEHLDSVRITDAELKDWLAMRAAKTAAAEQQQAAKTHDLYQAVFSKKKPGTSTKT